LSFLPCRKAYFRLIRFISARKELRVMVILLPRIKEHSSSSVIRMIKLMRMKWARHVVRMGEKRNANRLLVGKPEGKRSLGRTRLGGWIILRWILEI
jgi:hypothetical protein